MSQPSHPASPAVRFRDIALASTLLSAAQVDAAEADVRRGLAGRQPLPDDEFDRLLAAQLVEQGAITRFQSREMLAGRTRFRLGQYTVVDEIGRGGMGQVFKAEHAMMGRIVAVKVLPRSKATPESEAAFRREMRMLGRLDHENLVRAFDAGYDAMVYYLVTELVPGLDLKRQIQRQGPLDEATAASVISQAARGLAYAHEQGLVHRDVKPGNILVMQDGRVKVLDLGLAGSQLEQESARLGRVVGTMDYIAPEQIRMPDDVGPSADIYSLGCTFYHAVTGRVPFPGGTRKEKMQRHLTETPEPVRKLAPGLSEGVCRVIEEMMAKAPEDRLTSAADVVARLRNWTPAVPLPMPLQPAGGALAAVDALPPGEPPEPRRRGWSAGPPSSGGPADSATAPRDVVPPLPAGPGEIPRWQPPRVPARMASRRRATQMLNSLVQAVLISLAGGAFAAWAVSQLGAQGGGRQPLGGYAGAFAGFLAFAVLLVGQLFAVRPRRPYH